ncbi:MAG: BamA/TamA family outer membrane protein [Planctomycetota bacterium]
MKNSRIVLCVAIATFLITLPKITFSQEQKESDVYAELPKGSWYTLESAHFIVHFAEGSKELASHVADIAEDVHSKLTENIRWTPKECTHIVIIDWSDLANGWATPLPRNAIGVYPIGPGIPEFELTFTDDWIRMLITHEYTHILTIDMVDGLSKALRTIFGKSLATTPNIFMPNWILEGYAIYNEIKYTRGGRIRGPYYDMVLRAAVLEDRFNTLSQAQAGVDRWPLSTDYIYGGMFFKYLSERFGEKKLFEIFRRHSNLTPPSVFWLPGDEALFIYIGWLIFDPVGENGKWIFATAYETLWQQWHDSLKVKYENQRAEIEKNPVTVSKSLTDTGYLTMQPEFSSDGRQIAYLAWGEDRFYQLRVMDADGSHNRLLHQGFVESMSWSPDGKKIVFSKIEYPRGLFLFSDLYVCDIKSGEIIRLTHNLRARTPSWSPDSKKILFAVNTGKGNSDIAILNLKSNKVTFLTNTTDLSFFSGCVWSPDGKKTAFLKLTPGKMQQIFIADPDGTNCEPVTNGETQDLAPSWSTDGKYLLFTSSRTGIYNIFAYKLETKETLQITNVIGGALSPSLSPDGKIMAFANYSSRGWDIHITSVNIENAQKTEPVISKMPETEYDYQKNSYEVKKYSASKTILPTSWAPYFSLFGTEEFGAVTSGSDILEKHNYSLQVGYTSPADRPIIGGLYRYKGWKYQALPITASFRGYRQAILFGEFTEDRRDNEPVDYWEDQRLASLSFEATAFSSITTYLSFSLGYEYKEFYSASDTSQFKNLPGTGRLSSVYLSGLLVDALFHNMSISPVDGRVVDLSVKSSLPSLGSNYKINSAILEWSEYISVPVARHHVAMIRTVGGVSDGDIIDKRSFFHLGGYDRSFLLDDEESIPMRGYKSNKFTGTKVAVVTFEYRFPIWLLESGPATRPVFFRKLSGYAFMDSGNAWSASTTSMRDFKTGVGAGVRLGFDFLYNRFEGYALDLGFAYGINDGGASQVYLTLTFLW